MLRQGVGRSGSPASMAWFQRPACAADLSAKRRHGAMAASFASMVRQRVPPFRRRGPCQRGAGLLSGRERSASLFRFQTSVEFPVRQTESARAADWLRIFRPRRNFRRNFLAGRRHGAPSARDLGFLPAVTMASRETPPRPRSPGCSPLAPFIPVLHHARLALRWMLMAKAGRACFWRCLAPAPPAARLHGGVPAQMFADGSSSCSSSSARSE